MHGIRDALDLLLERFVQLSQGFSPHPETHGVPSRKETSIPQENRCSPGAIPPVVFHFSHRKPKQVQLDDAGKLSPPDSFARGALDDRVHTPAPVRGRLRRPYIPAT